MNKITRLFIGTGFAVISTIAVSFPSLASAEMLYRQLELGAKGTDVGALQTFLAQDPTIYPQGLVTNYFGSLTKSAVSNFQARNGISAIGRVGPQTLAVINSQMNNGMNGVIDPQSPMIYSVNVSTGTNNANVGWTTNESAKGMVYYSNSPLITNEHFNSVDVSGSIALTDATLRFTQNVAITGLQANTTYYYLIYSTDQSGNVSVTLPNTFKTNY